MKKAVIVVLLIALAGCKPPPESAFYNRGGPESLLTHSHERVNLVLNAPRGLEELSSWVDRDQPTKADLACTEGSLSCAKAQQILGQFGVPYHTGVSTDGQDTVMLSYDRVVARNCDNRYKDNYKDAYHASPQSFGCSMAANSVQMITNRREITNPALMPKPDGHRAAQVIAGAKQSNSYSPAEITTDFQELSVQQ